MWEVSFFCDWNILKLLGAYVFVNMKGKQDIH